MNIFPLKIYGISKSFIDRKVLDDITFEVKDNEIFGFVGLNGIGKTTLIKIILDLLEQDQGEVEIFGKNSILPDSRKDVAYLPEKFQPSNQLKGVEFLKFVCGLSNKKLNLNKAKEIAKSLDLRESALDLRVSKYSKGMNQKLGLLATFLSEAKLIILDEPMSGLDPRARIALKKQLISYKKAGNSIFFSSHILSDIDEICDRIAVINDGKIAFVGTPAEFKQKHNQKNLEEAFLEEIGVS